MKKLLALLLVAILGIGLGLAISPSPATIKEDEQICIYGKNYLEHCVDIYEQPNNVVNAKEKLDMTYPSYMKDADEYFVQFDAIGKLFKEKYFGSVEEHQYDDYYFLDLVNPNVTKFRFILEGSYDTDEILAKSILLLQEFRNYGFYYSSNGLTIIEVKWIENGMTKELRLGISVGTMLNVEFFITPDSFFEVEFGNILETESCQANQTLSNLKYDEFVINDTFINYVLDFN